ncbi:unnamed protein product [Diamesa tonsa]
MGRKPKVDNKKPPPPVPTQEVIKVPGKRGRKKKEETTAVAAAVPVEIVISNSTRRSTRGIKGRDSTTDQEATETSTTEINTTVEYELFPADESNVVLEEEVYVENVEEVVEEIVLEEVMDPVSDVVEPEIIPMDTIIAEESVIDEPIVEEIKTEEAPVETEVAPKVETNFEQQLDVLREDLSTCDINESKIKTEKLEVSTMEIEVAPVKSEEIPKVEVVEVKPEVPMEVEIIPEDILDDEEEKIISLSEDASVQSPLNSPTSNLIALSSAFCSSPELKVKTRWRKCAEMELLYETGSTDNINASQIDNSVPPPPPQNPDTITNTLDIMEHVDLCDERLSRFITIRDNLYLSERVICKINKTMKCDCTISEEEVKKGEVGCTVNCINRMLYIECSLKCRCGEYCDNQQFQRYNYVNCGVFRTERKGFGIRANHEVFPDQFIIEYVGEVLNTKQFEKRAKQYSKDKNKHYYFMALRSSAVIDATTKGNISRFINHSCDPNAMTQKWTVNGELRVGFFSTRYIKPGEEITFDYQFQRYGKQAQKCYCEAENCRGWIGENPISDEETNEVKIPIKKRESIRKYASKLKKRQEMFDDLEIQGEIMALLESGLKNCHHTLKLSRLVVRAKNVEPRSRLLGILVNGDLPCRRLFLDYNGLKLLYNWMCDINVKNSVPELNFCIELMEAFDLLPITNKTVLRDSKVLDRVEKWSNLDLEEKKKKTQLLKKWEVLKEDFKIPKKRKLEQMIEHEREADSTLLDDEVKNVPDRYKSRGEIVEASSRSVSSKKNFDSGMSKQERRQIFEMKMAQIDAEKRYQEMGQIHQQNCLIFGLNAQHTSPLDVPFRVNLVTGQYFTFDGRYVPQPPNHGLFQLKQPLLTTNPEEYLLPPIDLPEHWKYAIDNGGRIYYYHTKIREPQWDPPIKILPLVESDDDEVEQASPSPMLLNMVVDPRKKKKKSRRGLTTMKFIRPRTDEDKLYGKAEMRRYREVKEKLRRDKKRRLMMDAAGIPNLDDEDDDSFVNDSSADLDDSLASSSDSLTCSIVDELDILSKIPPTKQLEKIRKIKKDVDAMKPHEKRRSGLQGSSFTEQAPIIKKKTKMEMPPHMHMDYNELKHQFRDEIKSEVAKFLQPYFDEGCTAGRISCETHYDHLIHKVLFLLLNLNILTNLISFIFKLTYSVMIKESKHCEQTNNYLKATESVKGKTREYIKKYMAKFGSVYEKKDDEQDYVSILSKI